MNYILCQLLESFVNANAVFQGSGGSAGESFTQANLSTVKSSLKRVSYADEALWLSTQEGWELASWQLFTSLDKPALTTHPACDQARVLTELLITRGDQSQLNTGDTVSRQLGY